MYKKKQIKKKYVKQAAPSITEWISQIQTPHSNVFLQEDNYKYERLSLVHDIINLPFTRPFNLTVDDINNRSPLFRQASQKQGKKNCILRLTPKISTLPKLRRKGGPLKDKLRWFEKQKIDPNLYTAQIVPRCPNLKWASIFIVDDKHIWGEITRGGLRQLIQGKYKKRPLIFSVEASKWYFSKKKHTEEEIILKQALSKIRVNDVRKRRLLKQKLNTSFNSDRYMKGYFEFTVWPKEGIKYTDYNRYQSITFKDFNILNNIKKTQRELNGLCANGGQAIGVVRVVKTPHDTEFNFNDILVCKMITLEYLPLMEKAGGIITEEGTILCHAALIVRELGKPCIMQVRDATKKLKTGNVIQMNASKGIIEILPKYN